MGVESGEPMDRVMSAAALLAKRADRNFVSLEDVGMALIDATPDVAEAAGVDSKEWRKAVLQYLGPPHPADATDGRLDLGAQRLVAAAEEEAARAGHSHIDSRHLLAALLTIDMSTVAANARSLGLTAAAVRRVCGLPAHRRSFANGHDPRADRKPLQARYILHGGGSRTEPLRAAVEHAAEWSGVAATELRVAVVGVTTNRHDGLPMTRRLRRVGVDAFDTGINRRADAASPPSVDGPIHAVFVPGGDPAEGAHQLIGTPAAVWLADLAEEGVTMMGLSAGATIWGASTSSWFISQGAPEPVPMLGWIPNTVIVAHQLPNHVRLNEAKRLHPDHRIIAIGHEAVIAIDPEGVASALAAGDHESTVTNRGVTTTIN